MTRVLVLRPEPGASATVRLALAQGLDPIAAALFAVEPVDWTPPEPGGFDGLLLTSANAVRLGGNGLERLRGLPVYAVGEATAQAARDSGFDLAATGDAGVDRLLGSIEPDLTLLHLCGADRRAPDAPAQSIAPLVVYRSDPIDAPDLGAAAGAVALIHSPRAGQRFAGLVSDRSATAIAAISATAAEAVGEGWATVEVAAQPTDEALLALAARLCNKPGPQ